MTSVEDLIEKCLMENMNVPSSAARAYEGMIAWVRNRRLEARGPNDPALNHSLLPSSHGANVNVAVLE
jgi:hypothetical protein